MSWRRPDVLSDSRAAIPPNMSMAFAVAVLLLRA